MTYEEKNKIVLGLLLARQWPEPDESDEEFARKIVAAIAMEAREGGDREAGLHAKHDSAAIAQNLSGTYPPDEQLRLKRDAAEEMYEALESLLGFRDEGLMLSKRLSRARSALAKARGEAA